MAGPFRAEKKSGYWLLVDTRSGEPASYPTDKTTCLAEEEFMNRTYWEVMLEQEVEQ